MSEKCLLGLNFLAYSKPTVEPVPIEFETETVKTI